METIAWRIQYVYKDMLSGIVTMPRNWTDHGAELVLLKTREAIHRFEQIAKKPSMFEDSKLKIHSTILQRLISIYRSRDDDSEVELLLTELASLPGSETSNSGILEQLVQALQATSKRAGEMLQDFDLGSAIKAHLNLDGTDPFPAFQRAIKAGHPEVVRSFCEMLAQSSNALDILEQHNLHIAAEKGDLMALDAIMLLQSTAAAINSRDVFGRTPLCLAAFTGKLEVVEKLVNAKGDPRMRDGSTRNSLHFACASGRADVVHFLLRWGVSPNDDTPVQLPPLHIAAAAGSREICKLLLEYNAFTDDHNGRSAEDVALQNGHLEIAAMIRSAGKRPQATG
jgi:ankyrin repeat protein